MSRVADDLFLIVHDERSGRCIISDRAAGVGLAAALVGELLLDERLTIHAGGLYPRPGYPPGNRLSRDLLHVVGAPRQGRDLGAWLPFLAAEAATDVRARLVEDGVLAPVLITRALRWLGVRQVRYLPTNANKAAWPAIRLAGQLARHEQVCLADALLIGLVQALGLLDVVLWHPDDHGPGWAHADLIRAALPPELAHLVTCADAVIGGAVLAARSR